MKRADRGNSPEVAIRFLLLWTISLGLWVFRDIWQLPIWCAVYMAAFFLHAEILRTRPRRVGGVGLFIVAHTNLLVQVLFALCIYFLWHAALPVLHIFAVLLMIGKMMNSMTERLADRILVLTDVLVVSALIFAFGVSSFDLPLIEVSTWLVLLGCLMLALYYMNAVRSVRATRKVLTGAQERMSEAGKTEAMGRLTGGIAHDFNNLLTTILGNLELARLSEDRAERDALLGEAEASAQRAATLTAQLLAYAQRAPLAPEAVDLSKFIADSRPMLSGILSKGVRLDLDGASAAGEVVMVDRSKLETALVNLVLNAGEALGDGGRLRISASSLDLPNAAADLRALDLPRGRYVALDVADSGRGIPAKLLGRVAEPFFTTKRIGRGSGLGLSMAKGFAEQSRGALVLRSEEGAGTTVRLLFPKVG